VTQGLQVAEQIAKETTLRSQERYVHHYNLRARPKRFVVGQPCLSLQPDNTSSRMFSKWKGPAEIAEVKYPDSYKVLYEGKYYHLHANHLRPYYTTVNYISCSVTDVISSLCPDNEMKRTVVIV
jgi:hypothetical protein